jgi:hypothetical protein
MRTLLALLVFAALAMSAFASNLAVSVTGLSDTALMGTKIEVLKNSVVILNGTADKAGTASFEVADGYYIVRATRGFYPVKVQVASVEGNSQAKLRMDMDTEAATLYGKITYGKQSLDGLRLYATQKGVVIKDARVYPEGVYVLTFLDAGQYDLVFSKGEWEPINLTVTLAARETKPLDIELSKKDAAGIVALEVPDYASIYGTIVAKLARGGMPMNGSEISVMTPDGIARIITDANGEARINAAKAGNYTFTYANLSHSTFVEAPIAAGGAPAAQQKPSGAKKPVTVLATPIPQPQKSDANTLFFVVGVAIVGIGVILAGAVAFVTLRKQKAHGHAKQAGHEKMPAHGEEQVAHLHWRHEEPPHGHEKYMHPSEREGHAHKKEQGKAHRKK